MHRAKRKLSRATLFQYPDCGGWLHEPPKPDRVKRIWAIVALSAVVTLAACKDQPQPANGPSGLVTSAPDIVVKSVQILQAPENSVQGDTLYIVTFTFTNDTGRDFVPRLDHFVFQDNTTIRHTAIENGSTQLAGRIHNSDEILHKDEARDYMAAFLVYNGATGTLYYALNY